MSLTSQAKTQVETDTDAILEAKRTALLATADAIVALNNLHEATWGLPDQRLLDVLNDTGPTDVVAAFEEYYQACVGLQGILTRAGISTPVALIAPGRQLQVGDDGLFAFVPDPVI